MAFSWSSKHSPYLSQFGSERDESPCITCVQYRGGYHDACGGYLEYRGRCSVSWGISWVPWRVFSTVGEIFCYLSTTTVLNTPLYLWYPPHVSRYPHGTQITKDGIPHGTHHIPHGTQDNPHGTQDIPHIYHDIPHGTEHLNPPPHPHGTANTVTLCRVRIQWEDKDKWR